GPALRLRHRLGRRDRHRGPSLWPARDRDRAGGPAHFDEPQGSRARRPAGLRLRSRVPLRLRLMRRLGIDVGGTNTDAVLLEDDRVPHAIKTPTTADVTTGIERALRRLLDESRVDPSAIDAVMIGTTHFTNAVVERRGLTPVAAIRIGLPASASLEPFIDWPADLRALVRGEIFMLEGGHEYDGRPIVPFDAAATRRVARQIRERGLRSVGITSIFSPLDPSCEVQAAKILREECP